MTHALTDFLRARMDELGLRNRDVEQKSGLSRQLVSKYVNDKRDNLGRLPERATLEGFARALGVSTEFLLGKALEALGLGYAAGDFVSTLKTATLEELEAELLRRSVASATEEAMSTFMETVLIAERQGPDARVDLVYDDPVTGERHAVELKALAPGEAKARRNDFFHERDFSGGRLLAVNFKSSPEGVDVRDVTELHLPAAARTAQSVGRGLRRRQDEDAEASASQDPGGIEPA